MAKKEVKKYDRQALSTELKQFCHLSKKGSYIEICEWATGEGFDLTIGDRTIMMTWGEFKALKHLVKQIDNL